MKMDTLSKKLKTKEPAAGQFLFPPTRILSEKGYFLFRGFSKTEQMKTDIK